jgi:hypothetical protein
LIALAGLMTLPAAAAARRCRRPRSQGLGPVAHQCPSQRALALGCAATGGGGRATPPPPTCLLLPLLAPRRRRRRRRPRPAARCLALDRRLLHRRCLAPEGLALVHRRRPQPLLPRARRACRRRRRRAFTVGLALHLLRLLRRLLGRRALLLLLLVAVLLPRKEAALIDQIQVGVAPIKPVLIVRVVLAGVAPEIKVLRRPQTHSSKIKCARQQLHRRQRRQGQTRQAAAVAAAAAAAAAAAWTRCWARKGGQAVITFGAANS